MLYLFYGKDAYRLHKQVELVAAKYLGREGFAVTSLDMSDPESREALESAIQDRDIFGKKKVVVVRSLAARSDGNDLVQLFAAYHVAEDPALLVIMREDEDLAKKREFLEGFIQQHAVVKIFSPLAVAAMERWVVEYARKSGLALTIAAARRIIAAGNSDLWSISTLIDTLSVVPSQQYSGDDLLRRAYSMEPRNVWGVAQKFFAADKAKTASELYAFFQSGGDENYLFNSLIATVRSVALSGRIAAPEASRRIMALEHLDALIKSSRIATRQAIELLLVEQ